MGWEERRGKISDMIDESSLPELLEDIMSVCIDRRNECNDDDAMIRWNTCHRKLDEIVKILDET